MENGGRGLSLVQNERQLEGIRRIVSNRYKQTDVTPRDEDQKTWINLFWEATNVVKNDMKESSFVQYGLAWSWGPGVHKLRFQDFDSGCDGTVQEFQIEIYRSFTEIWGELSNRIEIIVWSYRARLQHTTDVSQHHLIDKFSEIIDPRYFVAIYDVIWNCICEGIFWRPITLIQAEAWPMNL